MDLSQTTARGFQPAWMEEPLIDKDFLSKPMHTTEEFFEKLAKELGAAYGLNDIREAV